MKLLRTSPFWNALALLAIALWLAPAVAWSCPRTGFIGDSPAAVMALAGGLQCTVKPGTVKPAARHCPWCPRQLGVAGMAMPMASHAPVQPGEAAVTKAPI